MRGAGAGSCARDLGGVEGARTLGARAADARRRGAAGARSPTAPGTGSTRRSGRSLLGADRRRWASAIAAGLAVYAAAVWALRRARGAADRQLSPAPAPRRTPRPRAASIIGPWPRPPQHPQLLDHRPHRPREVDAGRPHPRAHRRGRRAQPPAAAARLDGARARARDHDQGAGRARRVQGARRPDLPPAPDRHARATSTSPTRSRARSPRATARCCVVDASQGVEAQTVANTYLAVDAGLELIPALNKIDLPGAEPERVAGEIAELLGEDPTRCSGSRRRRARGSRTCSRRSSSGSRRPRATRRARRAR